MAADLLPITYAAVRWKGFIFLWLGGSILTAILLGTAHYGSLELKAPKQSLLQRFWPVKQPKYYVATLLGIAAVVSLSTWFMLFDLKLQRTGWSIPAAVEYAHYIFSYDESARPRFIAMALQPVLCTVFAGAYLLGGAKRKIGAWALLLAVGLTCALSAAIHPTLLWVSLGALLFAFLCVIDA
jgi:hypothetical protein